MEKASGYRASPLRCIYIPIRTLGKSDPNNPETEANYRIAYSAQFFYLYVEAKAEQLTFRDRAYQNGDGFL